MARRIGMVLFVTVALFGLAAAGLLVFATSESGSRYISGKLRDQMKKETGLDLSFGDIDIDVFPPRIRVKDVQANDGKERVSCTVEEAEFAPRPLDLLKGVLGIEEVYVGSPKCTVKLNSQDIEYIKEASQKRASQTGIKELDLSKLPDFDVFAMSSAEFVLDIEDPDGLGNVDAVIRGLGLDITGGETAIEVRGLIESIDAKWNKGKDRIAESLERFTFRTGVTPNAIDIRHLDLLVGGASLQAQKAHIPVPFGKESSDVANVSVAVPLELLNRLPVDLPVLKGSAGFIGGLSVKENKEGELELKAAGNASLDEGEVDEFVIGDVRGHISYSEKGVVFTDTRVIAADGHLIVDGNIAFDEKLTSEFNTTLHGIELGRLLEQVMVKGSYTTQKMSGPTRLKGTLNPLRLRGRTRVDVQNHTTRLDSFRSKNPEIALQIPRATVDGPIEITEDFFEAKGLRVRSGKSLVKVDMRTNFGSGTWRLHAKSKDLHMADVRRVVGFDVGGHGPVTCLITGKLWDPKISGRVALDDFVLDGYDFDKGAGDIQYQGDILAFTGMSLVRNKSRASITELLLDFGVPRGMKVSTKIESEGVKIKDLKELFDLDLRPYGSPSGDLYGRVAVDYYTAPKRLRVDVDLLHDNLVVFDEPFGPGSVALNWDKGELNVTKFDVAKGRGSASITGTMRKDGTIAFMGVASDIDTTTILNPLIKDLGIATTGQVFAVAQGTYENPQGFANVSLGKLTHGGVTYGESDVKIGIDGDKLRFVGKLGGEALTLEHGLLDLGREKFELEAFLFDLDLVPILGINTYGKNATLFVTGDTALAGSLKKKPNLSGYATMDKVKMNIGEVELENRKPLRVTAKRSQFQIKRTRFGGEDVVFDLKGVLGLERLNIDVKGLADLASASSLIRGIEKSEGRLEFKIAARGPYDAITLRGSANLEKGMVVIKGVPHPIERIRGRVLLRPQLIQFVDFKASCAEGTLLASGDLRLQGWDINDYQFRLKGEDLKLNLVENVAFTASTTKNGLFLRAPPPGQLPKVTGDLLISNLRYTEDIRIFELSDLNVEQFSGSRRSPSRPKLLDEDKDFFAYDVNLHGKRNLKARNNIFDVDLTIDDIEKPLRIVGTNQTFGFLGRTLGRQGEIRFAGKRFDINYASVDFQDKLRPENPNFYVTADGQVRDWRITLTAEGTPDEYEIKLASQPYLQQEDIIFVILTGLTRTEHNQFGGTGISLGAPILGQIGPGSGSIPLEFRIYKEYSEKADTETTRLAAGRWLTPNVWVSISSSIGEESDVEAELDYRISDNLAISAGYENDNEGSVGNVGMDLKFRLEF